DLFLPGSHDWACQGLAIHSRQHLRTHDDMTPQVVAFRESDEEIAFDMQENRFIKRASFVETRFFRATEVFRTPSHLPAKHAGPFLDSWICVGHQRQSDCCASFII